ncbi:MAG: TIR domain-containing protein [Rhodomicrobium sp.]
MTEQIRAKDYDVFISYKRADDAAREVLCEALEKRGYEVFWDAKLGVDDWKSELRDEIKRSKLVIVLWSVKAAQSENVKAEAYGAFQLKKLMSALIEDASVVPDYFKNTNLHSFQGWADASARKAQLAKILDTVERFTGGPARKPQPFITAAIPVELGDLPAAPDKLIGRDKEMELLRGAWESGKNAVVLHALGGAGKSALLRAFVNERLAKGGNGAARIYGWSAYSQGSGEQKRADADSFMARALSDFGYEGPPIKDSVERARTLAKLVQKERVLLLLDGLEPLQDPPSLNRGRFKDKGLAALVKALGAQNPGLMVLTSRQEVPELEGFGDLIIHHELEKLSDEAGADLLVELGVRGRPRELQAAVHDVEGHALSVTLLGTYLAEVCGGDIRHRDQFDFAHIVLSPAEQSELLTDKTIVPAKRAAKVMRGYLKQFEKLAKDNATAGLGGPERAILNLLGLFDRPADGPAVDALLAKHIPGLTDDLFFERMEKASGWLFKSPKIVLERLPEAKRIARIREAKGRLRKLRLLSKANPKDPHELDAHPVVRAFFAGRLEETAPEAAKAAHEVLYRHYAAAAPDLPDTLDEMQPLFHAVQHGVRGGHAQAAYDEIFQRRMMRHNDFHLLHVLGAFAPLIATCASFFEAPWRTPRRDLRPREQAWLLGAAASALASLGRSRDSVEPRRASLDMCVDLGNWRDAANAANSLCQDLLIQGKVNDAIQIGNLAVNYANRAQSTQMLGFALSDLANACTQAGAFDIAIELSQKLEETLGTAAYGFQGYKYGDLLLARGEVTEALTRGRYQLDLAERYLGKGLGLHDIGYAHLLMGLAQDALGDREATVSFDAAVTGFRKSGMTDELPKALLARAAHRRRRAAAGETSLVEGIRADLAEVEDIAGEEMRLYLTDLALERARLALDVPAAFDSAQAARAEAQAQTAKAAALIAETGYRRRDGELAELKARLAAA